MIDWHWPWAFYLLPLPLIIFWLLPKVKQQEAALKVPNLALWQTSTQSAHAEATERSKKVIKNPFAMMDDSVLLMDEVELSNSKVELLVNPDEASPADLAKTAWAFAVCRQHHGGLLTKLARRLTAHPHGWWLSGKDVSKLAWAYATLKKKSIKILNLNRKFHYET